MKKLLALLTIFLLLYCLTTVYICAEEISIKAETPQTDKLRSLSVYSYPTKTVYGAFEHLDTAGLKLRAVYEDGDEELIDGDVVEIRYQKDTCFRVGDSAVTLSFGNKSVSIPITVNRIAYDLSSLDVDGYEVRFNGEKQGYNKPVPSIVGLDGIPLIITTSGGGTNVGSYDVTIDFETASRDYLLPEAKVVSMQIKPAETEIVWGEVSFVYDGKSKVPTAYYVDVNGNKVYPKVIGAATNAGGGYIARTVADDSNYSFGNTQIEYEIQKANYDFSGVVWSEDSFVYDGSIKSISASGLPLGVSIVGYNSDRGIDAGVYTVTASLSWDEQNYNTPAPLTHTWEIKQAEYDISKFKFTPATYVYDGQLHYPSLEGVMPVGKDGIALKYSFSAGACHVSDGVVSVIISFSTDSINYKLPESLYSSVSITPLAIDVVWGEIRLEYSGSSLVPTAYSDKCTVKVKGDGVSVGSYIAEAVTENSDYVIKNDKISYTIVKAENKWVKYPSASVCYEGKEIGLSADSLFGEVKYRFYSDFEAEHPITRPTDCGLYYAVAYVDETVNYSGLEYSIVAFEIVKIEAVSFLAEIERQNIKAYQTLAPSDIKCTIINNDGSVVIVDSVEVVVSYENGDSFRKKDSSVCLKYGKFTLTLPVSVDYADYDLSGVSWQGTGATYDGAPKSPWLSGLPSGINVVEYVGAGQINAGNYTVYATVSYDYENYNEPRIPACTLEIGKCVIKAPRLSSVYNGRVQAPVSDSSLYSIEYDGEFVNAGSYYVLAKLYDSENYCFEGENGGRCLGYYDILPKTLSVTVFTVKKYLFEEVSDVQYVITDGRFYNDDVVNLTSYVENDMVYLRSDNPNYVLAVTPGKIHRLPYATAEGSIKILAILSLVALVVAILLYIFRKREKIANLIEIIRCRWANRKINIMPLSSTADSVSFKGATSAPEKNISDEIGSDPTTEDVEWGEGENDEASVNEELDENDDSASISYDAPLFSVDVDRADALITDSLARNLIKREGNVVYTDGNAKEIINVDTLSENFEVGEKIDVNSLKSKGLVSEETSYIKVLARGNVDKPLIVYANDFSLTAVKMIALTGGEAVKTVTLKKSQKHKNI